MKGQSFANRGRWFQATVDAACTQYRIERSAYIFQVPTPIRFDRRRGGKLGEAFFARKSSPDYLGFLPAKKYPPIGIAFDAKSTTGDGWGSDVPDHQVEALELVSTLGHIAGILLGFWNHGAPATWWVPWPAARQLCAGGTWKSSLVSELPGAVSVPFKGYTDFLPAIVA